MSVPTIPVLRRGEVYESLDLNEVMSISGDQLACRVGFACGGMVKRDLLSIRKAREALKGYSAAELVNITQRAGELYLKGTLPVGMEEIPQGPEDYVQSLAMTSGLPHTLIRAGMTRLHSVFEQIETILRGLTRGLDLEVFDKGYGEQNGAPVSFSATTDCLGVILPSNSIAVNALWIPSLAMKIPVVLKPGREEPWTPWRVIQAFIEAGAPREAFSFYPTTHDGSAGIIRRAGRVMLFGDDNTVKQYEHDPRVEVHGTGYSKILIGEDAIEKWPEYVDLMVQSISSNSGRSCINASTIVVPKYGDEIAEAVAKRLAEIRPLAADDPEARLSGFANPKFAEWINEAVESGLESGDGDGIDVTARYREGDRLQTLGGMNYLQPTLVRCGSFESDLAIREFLFPFASVVEAPQAEMVGAIGSSLVVTAITEDQEWIDELFGASEINRLNVGAVATSQLAWDQPHEGNLFEFMYARRSFQFAANA
ncbi:MAG: aldehyde dehydrogenase family protein [Verrucomicrobiota bacterium]